MRNCIVVGTHKGNIHINLNRKPYSNDKEGGMVPSKDIVDSRSADDVNQIPSLNFTYFSV